MNDKLQEIADKKRAHVVEQKSIYSYAYMNDRARSAPPVRGFSSALETKVGNGQIGLICEIKKASPSAGLIRKDFDPVELAKAYEYGGATCLSVLTDEPYFQGRNEYVMQARSAASLPILRKDFIVDLWQIPETRAIGADCILLIMAMLTDELALEFHETAVNYGLDVLIEVHDGEEMNRALRLPSGLIGINNRNLKTLAVDLTVTEALVPMVPEGRIIVCESGIRTAQDIARMRSAGVNCFLVGESLMRQMDVCTATAELLSS